MKKSTISAVFLDFDGTIADTAPGILRTMEETFKEMRMPVPPAQDMRATIGIPLYDALKMLGGLTDEEAERATATYKRLFPIYEAKLVGIFPKVAETLWCLHDKGLRLAVVTSRGRDSLESMLHEMGIHGCFETLLTCDDGLRPKPAPDMVNALLKAMGVSREEALVVGDTTFDIEMGNSAGCGTVAVTYGNHSLEKLRSASPLYIIDSFEELKGLPCLTQ